MHKNHNLGSLHSIRIKMVHCFCYKNKKWACLQIHWI